MTFSGFFVICTLLVPVWEQEDHLLVFLDELVSLQKVLVLQLLFEELVSLVQALLLQVPESGFSIWQMTAALGL